MAGDMCLKFLMQNQKKKKKVFKVKYGLIRQQMITVGLFLDLHHGTLCNTSGQVAFAIKMHIHRHLPEQVHFEQHSL